MILEDFHVHTAFCDGESTSEEVVCSAVEKGMTALGLSVHSYTDFDLRYCIKPEQIPEYKQTVSELKDKYKNSIELFCGIEQDYYSAPLPHGDYDYAIGSVHYIKAGDKFFEIDENAELLREAADYGFGGDIYSLVEEYYRIVGNVIEKTGADIIGHFDLITKFNRQNAVFDERDPRYIAAWKSAVDKLVPSGKPFEVNTGAISRGYTDHPYPSADILRYICEKGGTVVLSSDSHHKDTLCFEFDRWLPFIKELGFKDDKIINFSSII